MKRIGISIYPEKVGEKETIKYIKEAYKHGFKRIFANLLEVKNNEEGRAQIAMQTRVFKVAKKLGFEISLDVNPGIYRDFKLKNTELQFFKDMNVTGIRLDGDFNGTVEAKLTNAKENLMIEMNASNSTSTLRKTLKNGGNPKKIIVCHNFYPMQYTGLNRDRFVKLTTEFKQLGVIVAAFVTLNPKKKTYGPWKVNDGMPTIEEHRYMPIKEQVKELFSMNIDDIVISQHRASLETLKQVGKLYKDIMKMEEQVVVTLGIKTLKSISTDEKAIIFDALKPISDKDAKFYGLKNKFHFDREDFNSFFVRSTMPRVAYKDKDIKPTRVGRKLKKGDVIILNKDKGRYKGELHIILKDIDDSKDKIRNYVGKISSKDFDKIDFLRAPKSFKFKEVK